MSWYRGGTHFWAAGRLTQSWIPWNSPPLAISSSGGFSMCRIPAPAVIHWVAPLVIRPPPPVEVLVLEGPVDHVGDRLEATVGMPGGALGLARGVFDLSHLIHVDEGVEGGEVDPGEGPPDRETLALQAVGRGGHRDHRAGGVAAAVGTRDAGQDEEVGNGDSGHGLSGMWASGWYVNGIPQMVARQPSGWVEHGPAILRA